MSDKVAIYPTACPICGVPTIKARSVSANEDLTEPTIWFECPCGVIFQKDFPEAIPRTQEYIDTFKAQSQYAHKFSYHGKLYLPIVEDLTYGRKSLEVGFGSGRTMEYAKERGWITFGIEKNDTTKPTDRIIAGDFEVVGDFRQDKFDLVWMAYVLHKMQNPIEALKQLQVYYRKMDVCL